jgi:hypothetical protein
MLRKIVAVVLGSLAAVLVITVVQQLGMTVSPLPAGIDISDPSAIEPGDIPLINMLWVLASYALGVLTGGAAAGRISPAFMPVGPLIIGGLLTVASIMNMTMIPHPLWFAVINLAMMIPLAWLGGKWAAGLGGAAAAVDGAA